MRIIMTWVKLWLLLWAGISATIALIIGQYYLWKWVEAHTCVWLGLSGFTSTLVATIVAGFAIAIHYGTEPR